MPPSTAVAGLFDRYWAVEPEAVGVVTAAPSGGVLKCHATAPPLWVVTTTGLNCHRPFVVPGLDGVGTPCCSTVVGPLKVSGVPVTGNCALAIPTGPRLTTCRPLVDGGVWIDGLVMPLVIVAPDSEIAVPAMLPLLTMAPPARMVRLPPLTYEFSTPMVGAFSALALVPLRRLPPKARWQPEMSPAESQPQRSLALLSWSRNIQW